MGSRAIVCHNADAIKRRACRLAAPHVGCDSSFSLSLIARGSTRVDWSGRWSLRLQVVLVALRIVSWFALAITLSWCVGCGGSSSSGNTAHLQGAVTLAGQPLPAEAEGAITFRSDSGGAATAPIVQGRYDSPATPKGIVKVYFSISKPTGKTYKSERTGAEIAETISIVPASVSGGVDVDVSADNSDQNFDLAR